MATFRNQPNYRYQFASDNTSGICPEVMRTLEKANKGHVASYGEDPWTRKAKELFCNLFEKDCEIFFLFTGTATNALTLASLCRPFHGVICHKMAHVEIDEGNAFPLFSGGSKLILAESEDEKISPRSIEETFHRYEDLSYPKPVAISLTQATEVGTVYSPDELRAIGKTVRKLHLYLHMDGARLANAMVELKVTPRKATWEAGVDVLCISGTKQGMAFGEAIIFFNKKLAADFSRFQKQGGQVASKMRFLAAQWVGLLQGKTWFRYAAHANQMAQYLEEQLQTISEITVQYPRQANLVFVEMPLSLIQKLHRRGWYFYTDFRPTLARFACSWNSKESDIKALVRDIKGLV